MVPENIEWSPWRWHDVGVDCSKGGHSDEDRHDVEQDKSDLGAVRHGHRARGDNFGGTEHYDVRQVSEQVEDCHDDHGDADCHRNSPDQGLLHFLYDLAQGWVPGEGPVSLQWINLKVFAFSGLFLFCFAFNPVVVHRIHPLQSIDHKTNILTQKFLVGIPDFPV